MLNLSDRVPVDESKAVYRPLLADLQCNILSSHGRPQSHYFFLTFLDAETAVLVLRALATGQVERDLALESELHSRARRGPRKTSKSGGEEATKFSANLLLSARLFRTFFSRLQMPSDPAFAQGLSGRDEALGVAGKLNDPPGLHRSGEVHALYMVGYDLDPAEWSPVRAKICEWLQKHRVQVREEAGYLLRHPTKRYPIEPFGYRDSISQPLFYQADLDSHRATEGAAATVQAGKWSSFATLSLLLVPDPNGASEQPCGSYFAYRKIKQKVDVFYGQAERLAALIPPLPGGKRLSRDDVADLLIGRRVDGQPLEPATNLNDFTYATGACPMHAHVRKVNPRDAYSRGRRIARRATVFGPRLKREASGRPSLEHNAPLPLEEAQLPHDGVGLMFFCCQASIENGFEAIQAHWANATPGGADALIAQLPLGAHNKLGLNGSGPKYEYAPVVEILEGEYFFAPSLSFFAKKL